MEIKNLKINKLHKKTAKGKNVFSLKTKTYL